MVKKSTTAKKSTRKAPAKRAASNKKNHHNEEAFEPTRVALAVSALAASTLLLLALVATS